MAFWFLEKLNDIILSKNNNLVGFYLDLMMSKDLMFTVYKIRDLHDIQVYSFKYLFIYLLLFMSFIEAPML